MHKFKDGRGRTWRLALTEAAVREIGERVGLDLLSIREDGDRMADLLSLDPATIMEAVYVLVAPELDRRRIDHSKWARSLGEQGFAAATDAFLKECAELISDPRVRSHWRKIARFAKGK